MQTYLMFARRLDARDQPVDFNEQEKLRLALMIGGEDFWNRAYANVQRHSTRESTTFRVKRQTSGLKIRAKQFLHQRAKRIEVVKLVISVRLPI